MDIAVLLEKLIAKKYYENKETIENKLNIFYAMSKITDEQYSELTLKVEDSYKIEESTEETIEEVEGE